LLALARAVDALSLDELQATTTKRLVSNNMATAKRRVGKRETSRKGFRPWSGKPEAAIIH
jgi:hypothetical protein